MRQRFDHDGSQNRKHNSENNKYFILNGLAQAQSCRQQPKKKFGLQGGFVRTPRAPPPTGLTQHCLMSVFPVTSFRGYKLIIILGDPAAASQDDTIFNFRASYVSSNSRAEEPLGTYSQFRVTDWPENYFLGPAISETEFELFCNWFGKNKVPRGSSALEVNFRPKISHRPDWQPLGLRR